jgi:hypothetical protein
MKKSILKSALVATALSLSLLAPAHAGAPRQAAPTVGQAIASQGNAALRTIRAELKATLAQKLKPALPPRTTKVAATAAGSLPAGVVLAK